MPFYNTINSVNPELSASIKQTEKQKEAVLEYFKNNPFAGKTCWELSEILGIFITSVRRAVTNLIDDDKLIYNGMKRERMGKMNHIVYLQIKLEQGNLFND